MIALNGSGWSPQAATVDFYESRGVAAIETESAHAVSVPGAVASWARLVNDHGTREFGALLQPAIEAAEAGYPVSERVARDWAKQVSKLRRNKAAADAFLFHGATPQPGTTHRQPALAAALRSIAAEGPDAFYRGWIARDMVDSLRALGGLHTLDDFASFAPEYVAPISVGYRGYRLWECPPNGQGITPLLMAKTLEGYDLTSWPHDSVERYHILAEVGRQAFADRDCFVGDPRTGRFPVTELLSDKHAEKTRARVSRRPYCRSETSAASGTPRHGVSRSCRSGPEYGFADQLNLRRLWVRHR